MGYPICLGRCSICAIDDGCLAGNGDDDYVHARKDQVIKRLDEGRYNDDRGMMIKYLKDKYNYDYNIPNNTHHIEIKRNHYKITFADLRDVIESQCIDLISKGQMYENSQTNTCSCEMSVDLRLPRIIKGAVEIERSEDEILVTFTIIPSQDTSVKWSLECKSGFRFTKDRVYRLNDTFGTDREIKLNSSVNGIHPDESIVLLMLYQRLAHEFEKNKSNDIHIEIDEEEYAKHHTDDIKNSCTVNSFTDDKILDSFIHLTSDDGLFTLELNVTEVDDGKKDEVDVTTLASTIIRMSDYSDKEIFLNHIKNILREFPKATEDIFSQYYDSIPREPDLTTKISNILREAGVDESKIPDIAIALIDTMIDPDNE